MSSEKNSSPYSDCGKKILTILRSQRRSQKWLAEQCGVTIGMVNHIITGYSLPSLTVAIKIAKALDVTMDDIFCDL